MKIFSSGELHLSFPEQQMRVREMIEEVCWRGSSGVRPTASSVVLQRDFASVVNRENAERPLCRPKSMVLAQGF